MSNFHYHHDQPKPVIVLLSGWAGSGKDAAAALIVEELDFYRLSFADTLKREVAVMTGIPLEDFHTSRKNKPLTNHVSGFPTAQSPRDILIQRAAAVRATNPNHYAELVSDRIATEGGWRYVISDWRYPNEYETLADTLAGHTFLRVRIVRSGIIPLLEPSEHQLDHAIFDATIHNDGSISDLRDAIKAAVRPLLHGGHH
jgi:hypothetical protein